jgi:hypothetical protein
MTAQKVWYSIYYTPFTIMYIHAHVFTEFYMLYTKCLCENPH